MKKLKLTALALVVLLTAASSFTSVKFSSLYWFDTSDVYTSRQKTSTDEITYLHNNGYSGITLNTTASGGTLIEKGFTALGANQTEAGVNEANIYQH